MIALLFAQSSLSSQQKIVLKVKKVGLKEVSHIAVSGVSVLQFCQFT